MATCFDCGRPLADATVAACNFCGRPTGRSPSPWERRRDFGFFPGLIETTRFVCLRPGQFFSGLLRDGDMLSPVVYGSVIGSVGPLVGLIPWMVLNRIDPRPGLDGTIPTLGQDLASLAVLSVLAPVALCLMIFIEAGLTHLVLLMTGARRESFEATVRASSYARAVFIWFAVPFLGCVTVPIWFVVIRIMALMRLHDIGGGRASLAVLGPNVVCCAASFFIQLAFLGLVLVGLAGIAK